MTCGIYKLTFIGTNLLYIGKSLNIEARYKKHCSLLVGSKHYNKDITSMYVRYGLPELTILEETASDTSLMNSREVHWIACLNTYRKGLNRTVGGDGGGNGVDSENTRYTKEEILKVFTTIVNNPTMSLKDVTSLCNVSYSTVSNIATGARHVWLSMEYPEKYALMLSLVDSRNGYSHTAKARGIIYPPIISPEGIIYAQIDNVSKFAREQHINNSNLSEVLKGKRKTCQGWRLATSEEVGKMYLNS